MLVRAYGLMWRREEINWSKKENRLLGRLGSHRRTLRLVDFEGQKGICILYDEFAHYYVGLTRRQTLGQRLYQHIQGEDGQKQWDRFCWFGFKRVLKTKNGEGIHGLSAHLPAAAALDRNLAIKDFEAILMKCFVWENIVDSNFCDAEEWLQVRTVERDKYLGLAA
jgi:hypothetical protein